MLEARATDREQGEGGESLGCRELVAQKHIGGEGGHRHKGRDGVQQEAVEGGDPERLPQNIQLCLAHLLYAVPERVLQQHKHLALSLICHFCA